MTYQIFNSIIKVSLKQFLNLLLSFRDGNNLICSLIINRSYIFRQTAKFKTYVVWACMNGIRFWIFTLLLVKWFVHNPIIRALFLFEFLSILYNTLKLFCKNEDEFHYSINHTHSQDSINMFILQCFILTNKMHNQMHYTTFMAWFLLSRQRCNSIIIPSSSNNSFSWLTCNVWWTMFDKKTANIF